MNDFTKEQMLAAYRAAPEFVRDALSDPRNDQIITGLQNRLQLHIDTMGIINRETAHLLLGLINPAQYVERLKSGAGLGEDAVAAIVKEVNEKIFVPIRNQMRTPSSPQPAGQSTPKPAPPPPSYASASAAPAPAAPAQQQRPAPPQAPSQPVVQTPMPLPVRPAAAPANLPGAPRINLLEDHEEPHIDISSSAPILSPKQQPAPWTQIPIPPAPLRPIPPGAAPAPSPSPMPNIGNLNRPTSSLQPSAATQPQPRPANLPPRPIAPINPATKTYSADPYREPIDDK